MKKLIIINKKNIFKNSFWDSEGYINVKFIDNKSFKFLSIILNNIYISNK